jgi:hypothetical protein
MSTNIPDWMTARTFHPQLIMSCAESATVLATVSHQLQGVGFAVLAASPTETRLRHRDWFAIASGSWANTEIVLTPGGGAVVVRVTRGSENRKARKLGYQALQAAMASLREQGIEPGVGPWHKAP